MEILKKITKYSYIQNLYSENYNNFNNKNFWDETLKILNIKYNAQGIQNIPSMGPTILVANHPFGILDGLILSSIVSNIRKDYKILINNELTKIDHIKEYLYPLKFSTNKKDVVFNINSKNNSINHIMNGGCLITFPSGEVATSKFIFDDPKERSWKPLIGSIIKKSNPTIIPVKFFGKNSKFFQFTGFINNNLRRALFIRELLNKKNETFKVIINKPIYELKIKNLTNEEISENLKKIVININ